MSFLKNLESKSSSAKAGYTFGIAFVVTGIIAVFWVSTFPSKFAQIGSEEKMQNEEEGKGFGDLLDEAGSQLGNIIDTTKDSVTALNEIPREEGRLDTLGQSTDQVPVILSNTGTTSTMELDQPNVIPTTPVAETLPTSTPVVLTASTTVVSPVVEPVPTIPREPRVVLIGTTSASTTPQ